MADLVFMDGSWAGAGVSPVHGKGTGKLEFVPQPDGKALYRTNSVDYADGFKHRDWTRIATNPKTQRLEADYQDNEGFAIHYNHVSTSQNAAVFESDATPTAPAFRFTYRTPTPTELQTTFELLSKDHWVKVAAGTSEKTGGPEHSPPTPTGQA